MGELRDRMQQALVVRGMSPRTQEAYLAAVTGLAQYYHQRPDPLSEAQLQAYVRSLIEQRHLAPSSVRVAVMGATVFLHPDPTAAVCELAAAETDEDVTGGVQP